MKYADAIRAHDLSDVIDQLWANAALPRVTGLVGKPEPARLGPDGRPSLSQVSSQEKEAGGQ
jgi:hypothetical protein